MFLPVRWLRNWLSSSSTDVQAFQTFLLSSALWLWNSANSTWTLGNCFDISSTRKSAAASTFVQLTADSSSIYSCLTVKARILYIRRKGKESKRRQLWRICLARPFTLANDLWAMGSENCSNYPLLSKSSVPRLKSFSSFQIKLYFISWSSALEHMAWPGATKAGNLWKPLYLTQGKNFLLGSHGFPRLVLDSFHPCFCFPVSPHRK